MNCYCQAVCPHCVAAEVRHTTRTPMMEATVQVTPVRSADAVLADRLAVALRRLLRAHDVDLNVVGGVRCTVPPGSPVGQAFDAVTDWAAARGVVDDPVLAPWLEADG
jgi:hypothetical protein